MKKILLQLTTILEKTFKNKNIKKNINTCLLFHAFGQKLSHDTYGLSLPINDFMNNLRILIKSNNFKFLPVSQISHSKHRSISITIDDGYSDCMQVADFLRQKKIPFSIFIIMNKIGYPGYLSNEDLKILSQNEFCTLGSHTLNHPYLTSIKTQEAINEIKDSKNFLEQIIMKKIDSFSFPYGDYNDTLLNFAFSQYENVLSSDYGHNTNNKLIRRIELISSDTKEDWFNKIYGFNDFRKIKNFIKK